MKNTLKISLVAVGLVIVLTGASSVKADTVQTTVVPGVTLAEYNPYNYAPTGSDWTEGLAAPSITVTYGATLTYASTGAVITDGSNVPVGTVVKITPIPASSGSGDIDWFGTGYSQDSPYGEWGTAAPAIACNTNDFVSHVRYSNGKAGGIVDVDVFVPLVISPPAQTITTSSNLSCSAAASDGSETCTVTSAGASTATVTYPATSGTFYFRYAGHGSNVCVNANNTPMQVETGVLGYGGVTSSGYTYLLPVPAQSIPISFTAVQPSPPPVTPTLSCPSSVTTNTTFSITATATDSSNNNIQYGVDWLNSGSATAYAPSSGYVTSGTPQSPSLSGGFSAAGSHTINVNATDSNGASSGWASCTVNVTQSPADLTAGTVTPTTATTNVPVTLTSSVANIGSTDSGSFPNVFEINTSSTVVQTPYIDVPAGSNAPTSVSYTFTSPGSYQVRLCANFNSSWTNVVTESNYGNNCGAWQTVVVTSPTVSCAPSPSSGAVTGQKITWTPSSSGFSGTPTYTWSSSFGTPTSWTGSTFNNSYPSAGSYATHVVATLGAASANADCSSVSIMGPAVTLTANPARVSSGGTTSLTWSSSYTTGCTISRAGVPVPGATGISGTNVPDSTPITSQTTYTATCGTTGSPVYATAIVNLVPVFTNF